MNYPRVPIALLKGLVLLEVSGVARLVICSSAAVMTRESMLRLLLDHAAPGRCKWVRGVADTSSAMYFSCSTEDVVSDVLAAN